MTVGQLRREMTTAEFTHWIAFYNREARQQQVKEMHARGQAALKRGH